MTANETREARARQQAVREKMAEQGIDVLITGSSCQLEYRGILRYLANYYLPVFEEYLVIPQNGPVTFFAHDPSGASYAANSGAVDEVRIIPNHEYNADPGKCVAEFVRSLSPKSVAAAGQPGISENFFRSLARHLDAAPFTDFTDALNAIKMVKSPAEIALTEAAVKLNEDVLRHYLQYVKPGNREMDAIIDASAFTLKIGGEDMYWMVSSGPVPHLAYLAEARRKQHVWQPGDYHYIILEHSAAGGHWGETYQLVSLGEPKPEYVTAMRAVDEAIQAAADAIRPGATVGSVAEASDKTLVRLGYATPRPQGTPAKAIGHSQGVDVWEFPRIAADDPTVILPGMRFNMHPSVALPDGAVITHCDCWISTETGARRLSTVPCEILTV